MKPTEKERVRQHNQRARALGVPATLTEQEWLQTIAHFNGLCAYCQQEPFTVLEHFLPIILAGTTAKNCVPACSRCNSRKGEVLIDSFIEYFGADAIDRIKTYLYGEQEPILPSLDEINERIERRAKKSRKLPPIKTVLNVYDETTFERMIGTTKGTGKIIALLDSHNNVIKQYDPSTTD